MEMANKMARIVAMEGEAKVAEADIIKAAKSMRKTRSKMSKMSGNLSTIMGTNIANTGDPLLRKVRVEMTEQLKLQMRMISETAYAPNEIAHALTGMNKLVGDPNGVNHVLKYFDGVTNWWKSQAILRPGFHARNYMGGVINNWIGDVEFGAYRAFHVRFHEYNLGRIKLNLDHEASIGRVAAKYGADDAKLIRSFVEGGILSGGQAAETKLIGQAHRGNLNPFSTKFKAYQWNSNAMVNVENQLRGAMAWDRAMKGYTMDGR